MLPGLVLEVPGGRSFRSLLLPPGRGRLARPSNYRLINCSFQPQYLYSPRRAPLQAASQYLFAEGSAVNNSSGWREINTEVAALALLLAVPANLQSVSCVDCCGGHNMQNPARNDEAQSCCRVPTCGRLIHQSLR